MPDVAELGRLVKKKYPQYANIDDAELGRKVRAKYPAYSNFTDVAPAPQQQPEGAFSSFQTGVAGALLRNVLNTAADIYNRPGETLERAGRAGLEFLAAFDPAGNAYEAEKAIQEPKLAELRARAEADRPEVLKSMELGMRQEEAKPRTRAGRVAGGIGSVLGEVAFPTAPESAVANIAMAPFAGAALQTAGKFVAPVLRRIRGAKVPVAAVEEAAIQTPTGAIRIEGKGAPIVAEEMAAATGNPNPTVQRATQQFQQAVQEINAANLSPTEKAAAMDAAIQRIGNEAAMSGNGEISAVSLGARRGYPEAIQQFPANPNPIQMQAGRLPGEAEAAMQGPPPLEADMELPSFGVRAGREGGYTETVGPRIGETAAFEVKDPSLVTPEERTGILQTVTAFRKAGLMRATTHLKNVGGNVGFQLSEELSRIPGSIADIVTSAFTGRRTFTGFNPMAAARSAKEAATRGVREAWDIVKTGRTPNDIEGLQEIASKSEILNKYINYTFRTLKAEDHVFRTYALRRSLEDRARSMALSEIRAGTTRYSQLGQRTRELINNPPAELASNAVLDAEIATFNNPNAMADAANAGLARLPEGAKFAAETVVPFRRTPANVIGQVLEYSGVTGVPKTGYRLGKAIIKRSMSEAEQRAFSQTIGRVGVGAGLITLGYVGYRDGWLTGMQEDEGSKRARDTAAGRIPGAIKVNGTWNQISGLSPWGNLLAIGATIARETEQAQQAGKGLAGKATAVGKTIGQTVLEQPMLAGTKQIIEGLEQPGSFAGKVVGGTAGSFIPGHVSDIGQAIDYGTAREAKTLGARIQERIPGVRQGLPVRTDALGQPIPAPFPMNPAKTTAAQQLTSPLMAELVRLDIGISAVEQKKNEPDDKYRQRVKDFGQLYTRYGSLLVNSPQYQKADKEIQADAIGTLNERAKHLVDTGRQSIAAGPLSPAALIGAATGQQIRKKAKNPASR